MAHRVYKSKDDGVQIILQYQKGIGWYTVHGGDFYVLVGDQWLPYDHIGFYRWLEANNLAKFTIGTKHKVNVSNKWVGVNQAGLYAYIKTIPDVLLGSMITDIEWDAIMVQVLEDRVYAQEHGKLP